MTNKPKIYFLGSGPIAVPILKQVAASPVLELVGVGTQLDRPAGRSRRPTPTPVGAAAISLGLEPERIASVNSPEYLDGLRRRTPDIILVVSFGQILRAELLALPRVGCVNIHASLLPRYRGASPITQRWSADWIPDRSIIRSRFRLITGSTRIFWNSNSGGSRHP